MAHDPYLQTGARHNHLRLADYRCVYWIACVCYLVGDVMGDLYSQLGPIVVEENGTDVVLALLPNKDSYLTPQQAIDLSNELMRIAALLKAKQ